MSPEDLDDKITEVSTLVSEMAERFDVREEDIMEREADIDSKIELLDKRISEHQHKGRDDSAKLKRCILITGVVAGTDAVTAAFYDTFFINESNAEYFVREINVTWSVASTSGTLQVERLQAAEAKDAGDDLFASTVDMSATADTVTTPTLTATTANRRLAKGDRLGMVNGGTLTSQVHVCVTVCLEELTSII